MTMLAALGGMELILILLAFLFGLAGWSVGRTRIIGGFGGALVGFFFTILGVIIIYLLPRKAPIRIEPVTDEIKKYKELLDMGAITEDEYKTQKAKLLM